MKKGATYESMQPKSDKGIVFKANKQKHELCLNCQDQVDEHSSHFHYKKVTVCEDCREEVARMLNELGVAHQFEGVV
jgi:hypothetical protein